MARVTIKGSPAFTGHVGPVRFHNGVGEAPEAQLDHFRAHPDLYDVADEPEQPDELED